MEERTVAHSEGQIVMSFSQKRWTADEIDLLVEVLDPWKQISVAFLEHFDALETVQFVGD